MTTPGTYVSAIGHTVLMVWLIVGWGLSSEPLRLDTLTFTSVSSEDFDRAVQRTTPTPGDADPTAPVVPEVEVQPDAPAETEAPTPVAPPPPAQAPTQEAPPPVAPEPPAPLPQIEEIVPEVLAPPVEPTPAIDAPITERPPQQRPADRIASEIVAPEPDVAVDEVAQQPTEQAEVPAEATPLPPVTETAPPATATEIVTEADQPSGAVEVSLRPAARPSRPAPAETPQVAETPPAAPAETPSDTSVEDVLAGVVGTDTPAAQPDIPQGPPMTGSEREGFRVAVNGCWNVDPGSVAATVTVVVGFSLTQDGKVEGNQVELLSSQGDASAVNIAFESARRAILRCQGQGGYQLPAEKYGQWKDVEITFDPSGMRLR